MEHAIAIWTEVSQNHRNLWMFYIVIVTAVVGYAFSESFERAIKINNRIGYIILAALVIFMASNVVSMWINLNTHKAATAAIKVFAKGDTTLESVTSSVAGIHVWAVIPLHIVLDLIVIYVVYIRTKKK